MYLLRLALRPWRLAPFSQLFSAIAVGFLLFLTSFLFWLERGLKPVLVRLQGEQVITAYVLKDEEKILTQIRSALGDNGDLEIKYVDPPQFIQLLKNQYPDLGKELETLGQDANEIVPKYISISGVLPASTLSKIKSIPGIESVESSKDRYASIVGAFRALRWVSRVLIAGLIVALLSGLIHLSRMNAYLHRESLSLLRFWGATSSVLATPGMISGLIVGIVGGVIASGGWIIVGHELVHHIRALSLILKTMPSIQHSFPVGLPLILFAVGGIMGGIAGVIGSLSASYLVNDRTAEA